MRQGRIAGGHSRIQPVVLIRLAVVGRVRLRVGIGVILDPVGVSSNLTTTPLISAIEGKDWSLRTATTTDDRSEVRMTRIISIQSPIIIPQGDIPLGPVAVFHPELGDGSSVWDEGGGDGAVGSVQGDRGEGTSKGVGPGWVLR
jgi:hypothetical protein